ncbi:uncharacterized protein DUF1176 [Pseudoduganella flava]|uniref:DUF1176 domain-containing protein n=1 Tax=Pseudoduganella flava TaxID=871742 RepID=A0A562Q2X3_9BURK|nr:DUF1176 domain-containing protein [Pseudoduganella flava]QGZ41120.1 DUF1176 domain-containing protein [Pseudoduganella flava]TWI51045.1 uncharacterized protein DUF1176 [Pseudoduganella flava]
MTKTTFLATLLSVAGAALAGEPAGIHFTHHDWEVACDNTRTCRAAGYQQDDARGPAASVLLERRAGPREPVQAQLRLGSYDEEAPVPAGDVVTMSIDRRPLGDVRIDRKTLTGTLTTAQADALVTALAHTGVPQWTDGKHVWTVSGKGAAAVLLKIDEFQGRLGTAGALLRKGPQHEDAVRPALPLPEVIPAAAGETELTLAPQERAALLRELRANLGGEDCNAWAPDQLTVLRLAKDKLLATLPCWTGAYNEGSAYWVTNKAAPYAPVLVTTKGTSFAAGTLAAEQKGRGLGDCWAREEWTWDGRRFVLTEAATTGMCRLVAAGGAWKLPTYVARVKRGPR